VHVIVFVSQGESARCIEAAKLSKRDDWREIRGGVSEQRLHTPATSEELQRARQEAVASCVEEQRAILSSLGGFYGTALMPFYGATNGYFPMAMAAAIWMMRDRAAEIRGTRRPAVAKRQRV
jgi:hypothetical protein